MVNLNAEQIATIREALNESGYLMASLEYAAKGSYDKTKLNAALAILDAESSPEAGSGEARDEIKYIGPGALSKEQIDIHIIRRYLDNAPRKNITDKQERLLAIASLDRPALLASRPAPTEASGELSFQVLRGDLEILMRNGDGQQRGIIQNAIECVDEIEALLAHEAPKDGSTKEEGR